MVQTLQSDKIEVIPVKEGDWEDWDAYHNTFFRKFLSGTVNCNHIFSVSKPKGVTLMSIYEADGREETTQDFKKRGTDFNGARLEVMQATARLKIDFPGIKEIKSVELATKFRKFVPNEYKDTMCPLVDDEVIARQRKEKKERAEKRKAAKTLLEQASKRAKTTAAS